MFIKKFVSFALLGLALVACTSAKKRAELQDNVQGYIKALKNRDEAGMLSYVHPDQQEVFYSQMSDMNRYRLADVEVRTLFPDQELKRAFASIYVELFSGASASVMNLNRTLAWQYDEDLDNWFLTESHPLGSKSSGRELMKP